MKKFLVSRTLKFREAATVHARTKKEAIAIARGDLDPHDPDDADEWFAGAVQDYAYEAEVDE